MFEVIITAVVDMVFSFLEEQIKLKWKLNKLEWKLNKLRSSLALTRAFLQDAESRQVADKADDVLDELAYEDVRRKVDTRKRTQLRFLRKRDRRLVRKYESPVTIRSKVGNVPYRINQPK